MKRIIFLFLASFLFLLSCTSSHDNIAVLWTNRVDFAQYAEYFNSQSEEFKIVVKYKQNPANAVIEAHEKPDIVVGPWLKGSATRQNFKSLNFLLRKETINERDFYPDLLTLGKIDGDQLLLPVSFNLPTIIFDAQFEKELKNAFLISLDDMRKHSLAYNKKTKEQYTRMGFSPRWDDAFLYLMAKGFNASFEEANNFFSWDNSSLDAAVRSIHTWTHEINSSAIMEDEFKFNYLYDPPYALVRGGRCRFWYLASNDLFSLPQNKLKNIGFRWLSFHGKMPLQDDIIYAGLCKKGKDQKAAIAFLQWFYSPENQKELLKNNQEMQTISKRFGLAGGFSALISISEQVFPQYYPLLLAHLPQRNTFATPHILPSNWTILKEQIVLPYLREASMTFSKKCTKPIPSINKKIADWSKTQ